MRPTDGHEKSAQPKLLRLRAMRADSGQAGANAVARAAAATDVVAVCHTAEDVPDAAAAYDSGEDEEADAEDDMVEAVRQTVAVLDTLCTKGLTL